MSAIIKKDEIVQKLAKNRQQDILSRVENVNKILKEASDLPVRFGADVLGVQAVVREELLRLLKDAGWRVVLKNSLDKNEYEVL